MLKFGGRIMLENKKILMTLMGLEIGGAETHVVELARELKRRNFNIIVASNGGVYEKELAESGIKHYKVPLHNKKPINVIKSYRLLKKIIIVEKIDIVHAHARIPAYICGMIHKNLDFKFVVTAHWVFKTNALLRRITNWGEKTIAVSEDIKKYLLENYNVLEKNIKVTINGIDTNKFSPDIDYSDIIKEFNLNNESKKIVYISRMDRDRSSAAFHMVEALEKMIDRLDNVEVIVVGDGNDFLRFKNLSDSLNKKAGRNLIVLTGARTDINKFVAMSDLFIGVSRAVLEAMSAQKIVIVAGNEGYIGLFNERKIKQAIEANFTCRDLIQSNSELMKSDIERVLFEISEDEKEKLSKYSKDVIERYYSIGKMADDNIEIYKKVIEE
jgi:glycosyltransferase involved in cell wall biosynthesis